MSMIRDELIFNTTYKIDDVFFYHPCDRPVKTSQQRSTLIDASIWRSDESG